MNGSRSTSFHGIITKRRDCSFGGGAGTKGDCFTVSSQQEMEKTANCFSLTTFDRPCFYIKCTELYDEIIERAEDLDMTEFGFTEIKCVMSYGLNQLVVVGKYKSSPEAAIEDVLAKVQHVHSQEGGVGQILGISYVITIDEISADLDEADKISYSSILSTECYDITSSLSNIAIVTDSNVYWLNPLFLTIQHTTIGRANASDAVDHPFFMEDTYGSISGTTTSTASCSAVLPYHIEADCASGEPFDAWSWVVCDSGCEHGTSSVYPPPDSSGTNNVFNSYSQNNGLENQTDIAKDMIGWYDGLYGGTVPLVHEIIVSCALRKNVILMNNKLMCGDSLFNELKYTEGCHTEDIGFGDGSGDASCSTYGSPGTGEAFRRIRQLYRGAFFDTNGLTVHTLSTSVSSSRGLCSDGVYVAIYAGEGIEYSKTDGTKSGTHAGSNFTLVKGSMLLADGSATIKQVVLDTL